MLIMTQYKELVNMDNVCGFVITESNGDFRVDALDTSQQQDVWHVSYVATEDRAEKVLLKIATAYASGQKFLDLSE